MMWGRIALPLTVTCLGAMLHFGAPFDYTPLATVPAVLLYIFLRLRARQRRRAGQRFIDYDDADVSW